MSRSSQSVYLERLFKIIETKFKKSVLEVDFRNKRNGWASPHRESFIFTTGSQINTYTFTHLFYKHISIRHSCGCCKYTNIKRPSDITIGDFWGWEKVVPQFNLDDKGISLVLINTEKGRILFHKCQIDLNTINVKVNECLQPNLKFPTVLHPKTDALIFDYKKNGFKFIAYKYGNLGIRYKLNFIWNKLKRKIFNI